MANTYSQIYIHIVFAVKARHNLIPNQNKNELYKYISGIVTNKGHKLIRINGMPDHLHILIGLKPSTAISDLVRDIKTGSAGLINDKKWILGKFSWQKGFGAFSYSYSQIDRVVKYIANQEEHHRTKTFKDEYLELLKDFNIRFEQKYLFDWIE